MTDELTLLLRLRLGDVDALAELYAQLGGHVHALAWRLLGDREEAQEVLQDTFERVYRRAHQYRPDLGSPRAFVYTVARNEALSRLRARGARPVVDHTENLLGEIPSPSAGPGLDTRIMIQGALDDLSPADQALIREAFFMGFSHGELASSHALPLGTVKTRLRRALARMRRTLEKS
ncbi:putative RNA polymerase sigma E protein [Deinococcus aerolatus]|uniref:RNA polymerase sigma E protein n=1 Tax=Deinococcus aerolatus TaxID=522487 RepID=A0ABQ2G4K9_9DEIO|nr:RNA polymerase sigma factor [Deinococcus aerolatus]GGL74908.1 putative RNA polymerase sigma E protein [Deinococcus aerolatus]